MPTPVIIFGALGRMGREIGLCAHHDTDITLRGCIESPSHPAVGRDYGEQIGVGPIGLEVTDALQQDMALHECVIIHFSTPGTLAGLLTDAQHHHARVVIGTTGFDTTVQQQIHSCARDTAVLFSPNMSMGVNLLFYLTGIAARRLVNAFDTEIIEAHHRRKKDAPSGTAQHLGEIVAHALQKPYNEVVSHGRRGLADKERPDGEIGMHAVRGGSITGMHTVLFAGEGEHIELKHTAHTRATFARGALEAAKWLACAAPGLYSMQDVLDIAG